MKVASGTINALALFTLLVSFADARSDYVELPIIVEETFDEERALLLCHTIFSIESHESARNKFADIAWYAIINICDFASATCRSVKTTATFDEASRKVKESCGY